MTDTVWVSRAVLATLVRAAEVSWENSSGAFQGFHVAPSDIRAAKAALDRPRGPLPPKDPLTFGTKLGGSIEHMLHEINVNNKNFPMLIAHVRVMRAEKQIDDELAQRLIDAIESCRDKLLVDQGWRDVAGDALRAGDFNRAIALLFEHAPEAAPYVSKLEALARTVTTYANHRHAATRITNLFNNSGFQRPRPTREDVDDAQRQENAWWLKVCTAIDQVLEANGGETGKLDGKTPSDSYVGKLEALATAVSAYVTQARIDLREQMLTHDMHGAWIELVKRYTDYAEYAR